MGKKRLIEPLTTTNDGYIRFQPIAEKKQVKQSMETIKRIQMYLKGLEIRAKTRLATEKKIVFFKEMADRL